MLAEQNFRVLAADMDPQGNLSAAFLGEEKIESLAAEDHFFSVRYAVARIFNGTGNLRPAKTIQLADNLALLPADIYLADIEDALSDAWIKCLDRNSRAFLITQAIPAAIQDAAKAHDADVVLVDMGPNIGSLNRAVLLATSAVVVPVAADLYSIQGLRVVGSKLREWREEWRERLSKVHSPELNSASKIMKPIGYVVTHHIGIVRRPIRAEYQWLMRLPEAYRTAVLGDAHGDAPSVEQDSNCIGIVKHYRSLMAIALEANKPIFKLKPGDGAIGAHISAVQDAYQDFKRLSLSIVQRAQVTQSE
jgi:cellulose biosynthesis protein BcsQ